MYSVRHPENRAIILKCTVNNLNNQKCFVTYWKHFQILKTKSYTKERTNQVFSKLLSTKFSQRVTLHYDYIQVELAMDTSTLQTHTYDKL